MATSSRLEILNRIRAATGGDSNTYADLPRDYTCRGALDNVSRLHLMTERLR
jgi:hypothetical protein